MSNSFYETTGKSYFDAAFSEYAYSRWYKENGEYSPFSFLVYSDISIIYYFFTFGQKIKKMRTSNS
jgi:hypothetical protein